MKKLVSILCAAALALSLAACGAESQSGGGEAKAAVYSLENATIFTFSDSGITAQDGSYTGYEIDGTVTDRFPTPPELMRARPVFTTLPGWKCDIRGCTDYQALPQQAKAYVDFLESRIGYPITLVSTGPKRNEITVRQK